MRCYLRVEAGAQEPRMLHPFVAYLSEKCAKCILGQPSQQGSSSSSRAASQCPRQKPASVELFEKLAGDGGKERFKQMWLIATRQQRLLLQDMLLKWRAPTSKAQGKVAGKRCRENAGIVIPAGQIVPEAHLLPALESLEWPLNYGRLSVRPSDQPIHSWPLGLVHAYNIGLTASRTLRWWPRLAWLLCAYIRQELPDFRFSTITANKGFSAQVHCDGNNRGLSAAISVGDFEGGQLWLFDPKGETMMPLPSTLKGKWRRRLSCFAQQNSDGSWVVPGRASVLGSSSSRPESSSPMCTRPHQVRCNASPNRSKQATAWAALPCPTMPSPSPAPAQGQQGQSPAGVLVEAAP